MTFVPGVRLGAALAAGLACVEAEFNHEKARQLPVLSPDHALLYHDAVPVFEVRLFFGQREIFLEGHAAAIIT